MSKAYDRVKWNYMDKILHKMGFDRDWINLLMKCVKSVRYSININGRVIGDITPSRGLRQGDPLSPYTFVLCSQGLSFTLEESRANKGLQGIRWLMADR